MDIFSLVGKITINYADAVNNIEKVSKSAKDTAETLENVDKKADSAGDSVEDAGQAAKNADSGFTTWKATLANLASTAITKVISGCTQLAEKMADVTKSAVGHYDAVYAGSQKLASCNIFGIDSNYLDAYGFQITKGRGFSKKDFTANRKVVLLDKTTATALFPDGNVIGKIIEVKGEPFTVIGMMARKENSQPVINSMEDYYRYVSTDGSGTICIPDTLWPIIYQYDEPQNLVVRATSTDEMTAAGEKAADILNSYLTVSDETIKYKGEDLLEQANQIQEISSSTNQQLLWIASISLLVGGIGVMNIMLVSVTERTREIGLKKALGARKRRILTQFLTEAAVLTLLGGLIGVAGGIALAYIISAVSAVPVAISGVSILVGVVFSTLIGIIFGLLPSVKAANMNPIDALRSE